MIICPSILEKTAAGYLQTIKKLSSFFSYFQIDIADGQYVANKTASIDDVLKIFAQEDLSFLKLDFHLMVKDYQKMIKKILSFQKKLTLNNIFIHADLSPNLDQLRNLFYNNIGLVINPQDQILNLARKYDLKKIPALQIMSVYPGKQGQSFLKETLKKIEQLRIIGYRYKIFLDGGINDQTMPLILKQKFQPDVICPGSYFTKAKINKIKEKIEKLNIKTI